MFKFKHLLTFLFLVIFGSNLFADLSHSDKAKILKQAKLFAEETYQALKAKIEKNDTLRVGFYGHKEFFESNLNKIFTEILSNENNFNLAKTEEASNLVEIITKACQDRISENILDLSDLVSQYLKNDASFVYFVTAQKYLQPFGCKSERAIHRLRRYSANALAGAKVGCLVAELPILGYVAKTIWEHRIYIQYAKDALVAAQKNPIIAAGLVTLTNSSLNLLGNKNLRTAMVALGTLPLVVAFTLHNIEKNVRPKD